MHSFSITCYPAICPQVQTATSFEMASQFRMKTICTSAWYTAYHFSPAASAQLSWVPQCTAICLPAPGISCRHVEAQIDPQQATEIGETVSQRQTLADQCLFKPAGIQSLGCSSQVSNDSCAHNQAHDGKACCSNAYDTASLNWVSLLGSAHK